MKGKMKGVTLFADWDPQAGVQARAEGHRGQADLPGQPRMAQPAPEDRGIRHTHAGPERCAARGQGVRHLRQRRAHGPDGRRRLHVLSGLDRLPGHPRATRSRASSSKPAAKAFDKRTNKPFKGGERVCVEEMVWCGECKPCADGYPNHCERLDEIGINRDGGFAKYVVGPGPAAVEPGSAGRALPGRRHLCGRQPGRADQRGLYRRGPARRRHPARRQGRHLRRRAGGHGRLRHHEAPGRVDRHPVRAAGRPGPDGPDDGRRLCHQSAQGGLYRDACWS